MVGDSRAIVVDDNGKIIETKDHKPSNKNERERLTQAGARVTYTGVLRVNGLAVTRAIGDKDRKTRGSAIIATPEVISTSYAGHRWLVIASDGVWDRLSNSEVSQILKDENVNLSDNSYVCLKKDLQEAASSSSSRATTKITISEGFTAMINVAKRIVDTAYDVDTVYESDNISALVLRFSESCTDKDQAPATHNKEDFFKTLWRKYLTEPVYASEEERQQTLALQEK